MGVTVCLKGAAGLKSVSMIVIAFIMNLHILSNQLILCLASFCFVLNKIIYLAQYNFEWNLGIFTK